MSKKQDRIEIYASRKVKGQYGWRRIAPNGRKVAIAGELYKNKAHAVKMASQLFLTDIGTGRATIIDLTA